MKFNTRSLQNSCLILLLLWACSRKSGNNSATDQATTVKITAIKLSDLKGEPIDLDKYKGKVIFINFWATWCGPCIDEMPSIERAQATLKNQNIEFFFASNEEVERIQNFKLKKNLKLNFVRLENMEELNVLSLPTTFIFNTQGALVFNESGYRKWDESSNIDMINKIINSHE